MKLLLLLILLVSCGKKPQETIQTINKTTTIREEYTPPTVECKKLDREWKFTSLEITISATNGTSTVYVKDFDRTCIGTLQITNDMFKIYDMPTGHCTRYNEIWNYKLLCEELILYNKNNYDKFIILE